MDGQTVVVTGASRGIGAAVARTFADEGATVVACARDTDELADLPDAIESVRADVRDEFDVERLMETAARAGGGTIDAVVACAGVYHGDPGETPLADEPYAAFDDTMRTNVRGVFAAIRESLPHLADDARVLVPSGSIARETKPGYGAYAVSKAAAEAVVRGFATEIDQSVSVVEPGQVATDLTGGQGRDPEDVAGLFYWVATAAPVDEIDGEVVGLKAWKKATA